MALSERTAVQKRGGRTIGATRLFAGRCEHAIEMRRAV